ncbi:hypothetical protein D9M73_247990 [compost metagenome]
MRKPHLHRLDVLHLAAQRFEQRAMLPLRQVGGQQRAKLIETETRLLRGRDQIEHQHRFGRIVPVAVRLPLDHLQQADAFVEADTRRSKASALRQLADLHAPDVPRSD